MPIARSNGAVAETAPAPVSRKLDTSLPTNGRDDRKVSNYEDAKSRRILVQGITQAVAQSMALAGLNLVTEKDVVESVKRVTRELIAFVEEETK